MKRYGKFKEKLSFIAEEESIYHARTEGDLLEDGKVRPKLIDLFAGVGGPPCQGFSLLNKGRKDDSRKQL